MAHKHSVYDTDAHLRIVPALRKIIGAENIKLVRGDHNSTRVTFEMPRYVDGHDMAETSIVEIHFINISSDVQNTNMDVYIASDVQLSPDSDDVVIFSWLISNNATKYDGTLSFMLCFKCLTGESLDYAWRTDTVTGVYVLESLDCVAADFEDITDILTAWEMKISGIEDRIQSVEGAIDGKLDIPDVRYTGVMIFDRGTGKITDTIVVHERETNESIPVRTQGGQLFAKERTGTDARNAVANNYSLQVKQGYAYLNVFTHAGRSYDYIPYNDAAFGWTTNAGAGRLGYITKFPKSADDMWAFRVVNASKHEQEVTLSHCFKWGSYTDISQIVLCCTESAQVAIAELDDSNDSVKITLAPHSSIWVQGRTTLSSSSGLETTQICIM